MSVNSINSAADNEIIGGGILKNHTRKSSLYSDFSEFEKYNHHNDSTIFEKSSSLTRHMPTAPTNQDDSSGAKLDNKS